MKREPRLLDLPAFRDDSVRAGMCTVGALAMLPSGTEKRSYENWKSTISNYNFGLRL